MLRSSHTAATQKEKKAFFDWQPSHTAWKYAVTGEQIKSSENADEASPSNGPSHREVFPVSKGECSSQPGNPAPMKDTRHPTASDSKSQNLLECVKGAYSDRLRTVQNGSYLCLSASTIDKQESAASTVKPVPRDDISKVGVGMTLVSATASSESCCVVSDIKKGGPLDVSGKVQVGDWLLRVNDVSCVGMTIDAIKSYVVGPVGTRVDLVFGRHKEIISVELERFARPTSKDTVCLPLLAAAESEGDAVGGWPWSSSRHQTQTDISKSGDNTSTGNSSPLLQQYTTFLEDYTNKRSRSVTGATGPRQKFGTTEANTSETISSDGTRCSNGVSRRHVAQMPFQSPRTKTEDMSAKVSAKAEISAKISAKICSALHKMIDSKPLAFDAVEDIFYQIQAAESSLTDDDLEFVLEEYEDLFENWSAGGQHAFFSKNCFAGPRLGRRPDPTLDSRTPH